MTADGVAAIIRPWQWRRATDATSLLVGEAKAAERAEQRLAALRTTPAERIAAGFLLGAVPRNAAVEASLDDRAEAQIGLARRRPARS